MIEQPQNSGFSYVSGTPDSYTITRRALDISDYLDILRRHVNWILAPAFAGIVIAVIVAFLWPDTYVSEASMRITPPQVPQSLVPTSLSSQLLDRVTTIQQEVLSRDGLIEIIRGSNLYPDDVKKKPMEDIVEDMRSSIRIQQAVAPSSNRNQQTSVVFRITYAYTDKYTAQKVVREIVDKFIRLTNQGQYDRASSTTQFLEDQVAEAKADLDRIEEQLTRFRLANQGRLPDQVDSNLSQLRAYQSNLDAINERISRYAQQKLYMESQLATLKEQARRVKPAGDTMKTRAKSERLMQTERELLQLKSTLSALLERYTESHPDVRRLKNQIEVVQRNRDQLLQEEQESEAAQEEASTTQKRPVEVNPEAEREIANLEAQINLAQMAIEKDTKQQARLQEMIGNYSSRIESSPLMQQEYVRLSRDYDLAKSRYDDLTRRRSMSEMQTDLENRKQSELLTMLDQPSLPQKPTEPNRLVIIGMGLAIGGFLGVCLAGAKELKDTSLKNLKDVRLYSNLPVLGSVPLLENDSVVRRKKRMIFLAWTTALLIGIGAMSASMYYYYFLLRR